MAKRLGKKSKKKGLDGRDFGAIAGYLVFFSIIFMLYSQASIGNKEVKRLEADEKRVAKDLSSERRKGKKISKEKKQKKADLDDSDLKYKREADEYSFVVGTSLEYAQKYKLMMAVWEAIDKVRNVALRFISVEKNSVKLELYTQSDVFLTEFMGELNKRKDLIETIQITETKTEKVGVKKQKEALVGYIRIVAKRPGGASAVPKKDINTLEGTIETDSSGVDPVKSKGTQKSRKRRT